VNVDWLARGENSDLAAEQTSRGIQPDPDGASGSRVRAAIEAALATAGLGTFVVWAWRDGGFAPEEWLPGGLFLLALVSTAAASAEVRGRLSRRRLPLLLFGGYVVWSYLSLSWAQVPGDALDGANRTLVYWLAFALFVGLGISERIGGALVLAWGVAVATLGVVALAQAENAASPAGHFVLGRLAAPISYPDGDAALFLMACLPLLVLSSRREGPLAARVAAGMAAVVLADLAVLCQSRGSLVALPCALLLYIAVTPNRLRALLPLILAGVAVAPAVPSLLQVYSAVVSGSGRAGAVGHAATWIGGSAGLAAAGFACLAYLDARVRIPARGRILVGRGIAGAVVVAVAAVAVLLSAHHPLQHAERAWHDFTTNKKAAPTTLHFASGLGTSRYDVWRIALGQFAAHPVAGVGSDNYIVGYLKHRRTHEVSRYPESVELRALSETGIVGAALFFGFLGLALWCAARAVRRSPSPGTALACLVGCGYWLFHSSIDWFWEIPALTGSALALLAIAAPVDLSALSPSRAAIGRRIAGIALSAALVAAVAATLTVPWISYSLLDEAVARGPSRHSYSLLHTAADLNPFSEQPAIAEATLAAQAGDRARERTALLQALRRNRADWYAYFMLGIVAGRDRKSALARAELERAHRLSPMDLVVVYAQRRLKIGEPLTERRVAQIFRQTTSTLRGVRQR
jgi:O-Antigen ligase